MSRFVRSCLVLALALVVGCGGAISGLSVRFPDDRPENVQAVLARLSTAAPRQEPSLVVGVTPAPSKLFAYDLAGSRVAWQSDVELRSVPRIAGASIVTDEGGQIVVRRTSDGAVTARLETNQRTLVGADGEGDLAAFVLSTGGAVGASSELVVLRGGGVAWRLEDLSAFGAPAVRGGMVFLPWAQQNVSVLDATSGQELARVRSTRGVLGHAIVAGTSVLVGQRGLARFDERIGPAADAPWSAPLDRELPGAPTLLGDAYQPAQGPASASHRVRLAWHADGSRPEALLGDVLHLVFYRHVFALDAARDTARWALELQNDVVGARAQADGGLVIVDDQGRVFALAGADGNATTIAEIGMPATWAWVSAPSVSGATGRGIELRDQLLGTSVSTDARLVPSRAFSARLLAALPEAEATASLVSLCDDRNAPAQLHAAACEALARRTTGAEHVISALERHGSFLRNTSVPPVGALARAASASSERRAVPLLLAHLRDPQTPTSDIAPVADALRALADPSAAQPLGDFLRLYHAEAPEPDLTRGLVAVMHAYVALGGPTAREALNDLVADSMTLVGLRDAAQQVLTAPAAN